METGGEKGPVDPGRHELGARRWMEMGVGSADGMGAS